MNDQELKKLAYEIINGRVFASFQCEQHNLSHVFMVMSFLKEEQLQAMRDTNVQMLYESMDKAGPRSVNGYPTFFSCKTMTSEDYKRFVPIYEELLISLEEQGLVGQKQGI